MENYYACVCGFKCVEGQLAKTEGACPKCGERKLSMKEKYARDAIEKTNFHITSKQVK